MLVVQGWFSRGNLDGLSDQFYQGSFQGLDQEIKREHSFFKPANEQYSQPPPSFQE